jgi:hypothetical protein
MSYDPGGVLVAQSAPLLVTVIKPALVRLRLR